MRRTIFLALLATLFLVPSARAATPTQDIIRDCADDGVLQGHYTPAELRKARSQVPTDVDEYSDCSDVLSRAIAAGTASSSSSSPGGGTGGGTTGGTTGGGSGGGGARTSAPDSGGDAATPVAPSTPQDHKALDEAWAQGSGPVNLDGRAVVPGGEAGLAADVGRNSLPTTLIFVLALIGAAALAATAPRVRHRVLAHRQS